MKPLLRTVIPLASLLPTALVAQTPLDSVPGDVRFYTAERTRAAPEIDGRLDDDAWVDAAWTPDFIDIRGEAHPEQPTLRTRAKILWDEDFLYVAAEMEDPHLWATLTERDAIVYRDHDFEIFLDPDGDGEAYYEYEVNAFGTVFDLFLDRPYSEGGQAFIEWDMPGLRSAVHLEGTVNDPSDLDRGWTVEVAIPWGDLTPPGLPRPPRERVVPRDGDLWRVNFSRVHWPLDIIDGGYVKTEDWDFGPDHPEENWVWSPQGEVNMHIPSRWGAVRFRDRPEPEPLDR